MVLLNVDFLYLLGKEQIRKGWIMKLQKQNDKLPQSQDNFPKNLSYMLIIGIILFLLIEQNYKKLHISIFDKITFSVEK